MLRERIRKKLGDTLGEDNLRQIQELRRKQKERIQNKGGYI